MWIEPECHHEWLWVILILVLTALISSLPLLGKKPSRVLVEDAFFYAQPSRRGTILEMLRKGKQVHILRKVNGYNGSWLKVRNDRGNIGWITAEAAGEH